MAVQSPQTVLQPRQIFLLALVHILATTTALDVGPTPLSCSLPTARVYTMQRDNNRSCIFSVDAPNLSAAPAGVHKG